MLSQRLMLMLVFSMEPMAMVPVLDMLDLDIPVLDMLDMVVMDLAMAVLAMLVLDMLDLDIPVLAMLDMVVMDLAMAVLVMLVLATMARGLLMPSLRLKLMLVFSMEDMDMVPVLDMLDLDILVLDMLGMVVMDLDTVSDMDVPSTVKQLIYTSKSSK